MKKFFLNLQFIFRPSFWLMNYSFNKAHDKALNYLLDTYNPTDIDGYTARLGDTEVWISNYPYAVGIRDLARHSRPSRLTILKLMKEVDKATLDAIIEKCK